MCICMCIYIVYVCMYVYTYIPQETYLVFLGPLSFFFRQGRIYIQIFKCIFISEEVAYIYLRIYMYLYVCIYICICVRTCELTRVCVYIHTLRVLSLLLPFAFGVLSNLSCRSLFAKRATNSRTLLLKMIYHDKVPDKSSLHPVCSAAFRIWSVIQSIFNLNILGLFSTERCKRDLEN